MMNDGGSRWRVEKWVGWTEDVVERQVTERDESLTGIAKMGTSKKDTLASITCC